MDRCFIDLLAYVRVLDLLDNDADRFLLEAAKTSLTIIDTVFYVPICEALHSAATTNESAEFRARIDLAIPRVAEEVGVQLIHIQGQPVQRAEAACERIMSRARHISFTRDTAP
jgi:hypothetical protein